MTTTTHELTGFDRDELTAWLASPETTAATALHLSMPLDPDDDGRWIVDAFAVADLPRLRSLTLSYCDIGDAGLVALARTAPVRHLDTLVVHDWGVTGCGAASLATALPGGRLTGLRLTGPELDDNLFARVVADSTTLGGLTCLDVDLDHVGSDVLVGLARNPTLSERVRAAARARAGARAEELLHHEPSAQWWLDEVVDLLAASDVDDLAVPRRWPARHRPAPHQWLDPALTASPVPELRLAGCLQPYRLRGCGRTAEDLEAVSAVMRHPDAVNLRRVDLRYLRLDPATLSDWLRRDWLAGVTALDLSDHPLTTGVLDALADNPAAADLRVLGSARCDPAALARLTGHRLADRLQALQVCGADLADEGGRVLAGAACLPRLRGLGLRNTGLGTAGLAALLAAGMPALAWLDLSENPVGDDAAHRLARATLPALTRVDLGYPHEAPRITDAGALALARADLPALVDLGVEFHGIGDVGAVALAARPGLRRLRIAHGNPVTPEGARRMVRAAGPGLRVDISAGCGRAFRDDPEVATSSLADRYDDRAAGDDPFDPVPYRAA